MQKETNRQLAAIMFADMVGYTALMQEDEEKARVQRDRHRAIQTDAVSAHHGEILQYYGDGTLSIFPSAVEAVQCAVAIQSNLKDDELVPLRIGVHTGDIVRDQDGVYGDSVNVASRIEALAAPGGIVVSDKVFDEIKNHPSLSAVSLGPVRLKNVERATPVFAISNEGLSVPTEDYVQARAAGRSVVPQATAKVRSGGAGEAISPQPGPTAGAFVDKVKSRSGVLVLAILLAVAVAGSGIFASGDRGEVPPGSGPGPTAVANQRRPIIAVLPFLNMSAQENEDAAFLATGLHDELLTQLSKIAGLDVIARTSVMQYVGTEKTMSEIGHELGANTVLEGSLMRAGDQVRLNVQLIEAETNTHLWAETYDREFTVVNVFDIQSDLADQVALALQARVVPEEQARIAERPTESMDAYTLYLRGIEAHVRPGWEPEDLESAAAMFAAATEADPEFALAYAWLSITHSFFHLYYDRSGARLIQAQEAAEDALHLNAELPEGHLAKAFFHFQRYENDEAARALAIAESGLPGSSNVLTLKSELLTRRRQWDASLAVRERAALLDPMNPELAVNLAMAYADLGRWDEANAVFDRILTIHPTFFEAAFVRGWLTWRRTGDGELGLAALAQVPPEVNVFGLRDFFGWLMTDEPEARVAALEKIDQETLDYGGFWWAPRTLLEGWTYKTIDPPRAKRAFAQAVDACKEALEEAPEDPRIHASLGRAYAGLGRNDEAVREAQRVADILPIALDPVFGRDLLEISSIIYAELGMAEEAADAMEGVFSVPGVRPMVHILGPEFELIRDHPRIQAIIERQGEEVR